MVTVCYSEMKDALGYTELIEFAEREDKRRRQLNFSEIISICRICLNFETEYSFVINLVNPIR